MIHVCSLARLHDTVRETGARHVVTLIKDVSLVHRPASITAENHLLLDMDDITDHIEGYVAPAEDACRRPVALRARLGSRGAAGGALLCGDQPFDRGCVRHRLRAQSAARRDEDRTRAARRLADRDAEHPHRLARRRDARARRPHDRGDPRDRARHRRPMRASRSGSISSRAMADTVLTPIEIGLTAAIVAVEDGEPAILVAGDGEKGEARAGLPFGPFDPLAHRTFEIGLRAWVEAQTGLRVGYVEQLYTFGDRGRHAGPAMRRRMSSRSAISRSRASRKAPRR